MLEDDTCTGEATCKAKSSGKLQFCNRHFVISGVLSPPPNPHQNHCGSIIFIADVQKPCLFFCSDSLPRKCSVRRTGSS